MLQPEMTVFQFIIGCLACYRVTILISRDYGPFGIFAALRKLHRFFGCPFCTSIYVGLIVRGFLPLSYHEWTAFLEALAFSAVTIILDRIFTSDYKADK